MRFCGAKGFPRPQVDMTASPGFYNPSIYTLRLDQPPCAPKRTAVLAVNNNEIGAYRTAKYSDIRLWECRKHPDHVFLFLRDFVPVPPPHGGLLASRVSAYN